MKRGQLSRGKVLRAAVALVDEQGLDALSMRRLGERLGVEAMSLYRYVEGKDDLLNGVHGAILEEMEPPPKRGGWQRRLRGMATAFREVLEQHPNALPLFARRPAVTPESMQAVEDCLAVLAEAGFGPAERLHAFQTLAGFVIGTASLHFGLEEEAYGEDWAPQGFPLLVESLVAMGPDIDAEFAFGLDAMIAGFEARVGRPKRR